MPPKPASDSFTEMVQVVLPNDANPLGFILGGTVMHLIDIAGAIACHRHTRSLLVTAAVDGLQFLHPIKVGDLIILRARVTATFQTSLEVAVEVYSEGVETGERKLTSLAYLTFVTVDRAGGRVPVPPLLLETDAEREEARRATDRRAARLAARAIQEGRGQKKAEGGRQKAEGRRQKKAESRRQKLVSRLSDS
jgi:acyl-CoA hydrolase